MDLNPCGGRTAGNASKTAVVVAAAAAVGCVAVVAWAYKNREPSPKRNKRTVLEEDDAKSELPTEREEEAEGLHHQSWFELVEEEEEQQQQPPLEQENMANNSFVPSSEEVVTAKLAKLEIDFGKNIEQENSVETNGVTQGDEQPQLVVTTGNTDSGAVSPSGVCPMNIRPHDENHLKDSDSSKQKQKNPSGGSSVDAGFDCSSSSSSSSPSGEEDLTNGSSITAEAAAENGEELRSSSGMSDSGQGSEPDDRSVMVYQFNIPNNLCGKFIGTSGSSVKSLMYESACNVRVAKSTNSSSSSSNGSSSRWRGGKPFEMQLCSLKGTRTAIEKCLEIIRDRFPLDQNPGLTLEQVNPPLDDGYYGQAAQSPEYAMLTGDTRVVSVSAIESAGHVFLQQFQHPMFPLLERLEECMSHVYGEIETPMVPSSPKVPEGLICVANYQGQWTRAQVISHDLEANRCWIKSLDWGGYSTCQVKDLRQIRDDFLTLPFQAFECYLSNVVPLRQEIWSTDAAVILQQLVAGKVCTAHVVSYGQDLPQVHLYASEGDADANHEASGRRSAGGYEADDESSLSIISVGRELVERGVAAWVEDVATCDAHEL